MAQGEKDSELQIAIIKLKEDFFQQRVADQNKLQEQLKVIPLPLCNI
jgi:hypothetical protein